jgi:hypothetical protein
MGGATTCTTKLQFVLSPQASLAVTLTVVSPTGKVLPLGGLATMVGGGLHPPLALAVKKTAAPLVLVAVATMFEEQFNRIGVFVFTTVTVKLQAAPPLASLASHHTAVVPMGKMLPEAGLAVTAGDTPHKSLAFTLKYTAMGTAEVTTMFVGQLIDTMQLGGSMMTVKPQFVLLPHASLAVTVTSVSPTGNTLPLGGSATTLSGAQPPLASVSKYTTAPSELAAVAVMFVEQFKTMGALATVTVKLQLVLLPQASLAVTSTMFVPIGKVLPLGGLAMMVGGLHPPEAVTVKNTAAPLELVAAVAMLEEQFSTIGG